MGRNKRTLKDYWSAGPRTNLGLQVPGFPNMFIIAGPQGPFANFPPVIESEINFAMACIQHAEEKVASKTKSLNGVNGSVRNGHVGNGTVVNGVTKHKSLAMEVSESAEAGWGDLCNSLIKGSLFTRRASWIFSQNIPGRKPSTNFYFGGLRAYLEWVEKEISEGFPGFTIA